MISKQKFGKHEYIKELHREALDRPEEINLVGTNKHSAYARKMNKLEELELDAFKRVQLTKKERNKLRQEAKADDAIDQLDDLKDIHEFLNEGNRRKQKEKEQDLHEIEKRAFQKQVGSFMKKRDQKKRK